MKMTFDQYIINPMQSPVFTAVMRESMRNNYSKKFNALILREHGVFNYFLYKDEENNRFYAHFKIPSETVQKIYYDTVIEFSADENIAEGGKNLFKYNIRFFSNDPSFVYSYAYTFNLRGLFINEMSSQMSQKALREPAKEKNPTNMIGYVKTIYFAYLFMKLRSLNNIDTFKAQASVIRINDLPGKVIHADQKLREREDAGVRLAKKNKVAKEKEKRDKQKQSELAVRYTKNTRNSINTNSIKTTKVVRKTKRK